MFRFITQAFRKNLPAGNAAVELRNKLTAVIGDNAVVVKPTLSEGWREVKNELPVKMGLVQIYTKSGYAIGYCSDEGKWNLFYGVDKPIAWMPIPKPPAFA